MRLASKAIDEALREVRKLGFEPCLTPKLHTKIVNAGFNRANLAAAFILTELAFDCDPVTVSFLMHRAHAVGLYPSTSKKYYQRTARAVLKLRRAGLIPCSRVVDSTRRRSLQLGDKTRR